MIQRLIATSACVLALAAGAAMAETATAKILGTGTNADIKGNIKLEDTAGGLKLSGDILNVPAGTHAFHIHEFGSCEDNGKAAGSHYNPAHAQHGDVMKSGVSGAHAGDLGNVTAGSDGRVAIQITVPGVTLVSMNPVAGRALVLHEKIDDFSQPAGNAGGRIACGGILLTGATANASPMPSASPSVSPSPMKK